MKYNNKINNLLRGAFFLAVICVSFSSCTDWLDKDPEAIVSEDEAFKNFRNFQGYVEEIYSKVPHKEHANYCSAWNFGDDAVHNPEGYAHMDHQVDLGNYNKWWENSQCWLNGNWESLWGNCWYCIRKCNQGIEHIKDLIGTDEERDLLLGQMYFFRAWWHFEVICYLGGMPYIDQTFESSDIPELPRLSFQQCADKCAEDFQRAADLLPVNWDETLVGQNTQGKNDLRINKIMALCYLGKCYLWAGSPLMKEFEKWNKGEQYSLLGASKNGKTYDYDTEYCRKAAEVLGKVLEMVGRNQCQYQLAEYKYDNIYDHERSSKAETCFSDIFYTYNQNWLQPGTCEAIFRGLSPDGNSSNWNNTKIFGPKIHKLVDHDNIIHHPTANLIDQYGMSNGQPIYFVKNGVLELNPESGWDPTHPYRNRDPRFYHDIVFDGFHYILNTEPLNEIQKRHDYCTLYTDGAMRSVDNGSSTGYFIQKLVPHQCNFGDKWYDAWGGGAPLHTYLPYMRLADVYLMYAEALAATTGAKSSSNTCSLTAVEAINALRDRVNSDDYPMEHVPANLMNTKEDFIDAVRNERAVELAFEGFRWCDLQRWLLLTEPPYTIKYSHEFERVDKDPIDDKQGGTYEGNSWYKTHDPKDGHVANFHRETLIERPLDSKHYWFPIPEKDVYLYEAFKQNPGW